MVKPETKEIYATTMTKTNINMSASSRVKAGKCIFPFKMDQENCIRYLL